MAQCRIVQTRNNNNKHIRKRVNTTDIMSYAVTYNLPVKKKKRFFLRLLTSSFKLQLKHTFSVSFITWYKHGSLRSDFNWYNRRQKSSSVISGKVPKQKENLLSDCIFYVPFNTNTYSFAKNSVSIPPNAKMVCETQARTHARTHAHPHTQMKW
jgi:hypothetical protein